MPAPSPAPPPAPDRPRSPLLTVRLFDGFEVQSDGARLELKSRSGDHVFAYLALIQGQDVEKAFLAEQFWIAGAHGEASLKKCLQDLGKCLGPHTGRLDRDRTLALDLSGADAWCDWHEFCALAVLDDETSLRRAAALYTGPLLKGWNPVPNPWTPFRRRAEHLILDVYQRLAARCAARGEYHAAERWMQEHTRVRPEILLGWNLRLRYLQEAGEPVLISRLHEEYENEMSLLRPRITPPPRLGAGAGSAPALDGSGLVPPQPVGPLPPGAAHYLERHADVHLRRALNQFEGIIRIKGPRGSGKSSLLARGLEHARASGARVLVTDFDDLTEEDLQTPAAFCRRMIAQLSEQSGIVPPPRRSLSAQPGADLHAYVRWGLLDAAAVADARVVWAMDNVDRLFSRPWREDLFRLLRSWHNLRATQPDQPWRRLCQLIACSMEARLYLRDLDQSPFNTSEQVDVGDFTPEQARWLHARYGDPLGHGDDRARFDGAVGGHPFLLHRGLYAVAVERLPVADLLARWERGEGPLGDHLRRLARTLTDDPELRDAVRAALHGEPCGEEAFLRLRSAGVLTGPHAGEQSIRCRLYEAYLSRHLL